MRKWRFSANNSIAYRLFVIYLVAISIPVYLYGAVSYSLSARNVENNYIRNKAAVSDQVMRNIDENVLILQKQSASLFLISKEITYILGSGPGDTSDAYFDYKERLDRYFLALIQMNDKLNGITLINTNGEVKYAINVQGRNSVAGSVRDEPWFRETLALNGAPHFLDPHTNDFLFNPVSAAKPIVISVAQSITDYNADGPAGVLLVDQNTQQFFGDIANINLQEGEQTAIVSRTGKLIYSNVELGEQERAKLLSVAKGLGRGQTKTDVGGRSMLVIASAPSQYGFQVVSLLPTSELQKKSGFLRSITAAMLLVVSAIVLLISIVVSFLIVKPLRRLMPSFKQLELGNFSTRVPVKGNDELARISQAFNSMVGNIESLIVQKYEANLLRNQAELNALQSQINPHFLYNTLYATKSVIDRHDYGRASAMVQSLSEIFRYSLQQGSSVVTLREEIDHIRKYIYVHDIRFAGRFSTVLEIDDSLWDNPILRLTLQPLVENAIQHGLANKAVGGELRITAKPAGDHCLIYIYDNGAGMSEAEISRLNGWFASSSSMPAERPEAAANEPPAAGSAGTGLGVRNVHARIKLQFGPEFGIKISGKAGAFTTVKITLPLHDSLRKEAG
ncbi:cache domain-containing sensor histidine kinase [Cohnella rhizosphaerae]|uniref:histidine kinase n=1 Tax=Cohnella rhizosphaerae TaxID=1457232 RepID=A0A9X4KTK4_9BACL|nr:sensor histidine kinase [Cohnella rhizosphaerae]MDG0808584.1 sensor histidine kinase [Cohnella rhizosphaerae]